MTRLETYLRYQDVFGTPSTFEQFEAELRSLDLGLVLRTFAAINVICSRRGLPRDQRTQVGLIRELFDPVTAKLVEAHSLTVFHRHQCLFILSEAGRCCPDRPDMVITPEIAHRIGMLALMSNEHDSSPSQAASLEPWSLPWLEQMMCDYIPITEANELRFDFASVPRMHKLVNELAPARAALSGAFDVATLFEEATGLPLRIFEALMLGILPRIMQSAGDLMTRSPHYGVHIDFFEPSTLETKYRDTLLRLLSRTSDEFSAGLATRPRLLSDFTAIKEAPFVRNQDRIVPLDTLFGLDKFESTVFWAIYKYLPGKQRQNFSSFWSGVFEDYISWLLANSVDQRMNRFYPSPRYVDNHNEEVCDGIVVCGTTAIFIECKGGIILGSAKYGGSPSALRDELELKYVKPKGVFQIAKSIARALRNSQRPTIQGLDLSNIRTVMPVLVTRDEVGESFFVNSFLNARFTEAKREHRLDSEIYPVYCSQLFSLSVDTIERLSPYLHDTRLAEILSEHYLSDPLLVTPFFIKENGALRRKGLNRPPELLRAMNNELRDTLAGFLKLDRDAVPQK